MAGLKKLKHKVGKGIVTHFRKLTLRVSRRHRSTSTHSAVASTAESAVLHTGKLCSSVCLGVQQMSSRVPTLILGVSCVAVCTLVSRN